MTVKAEIRHLRNKQFRIIRDVGIVTGKALTLGNRRVFHNSAQLCFIVAAEAELRALCKEELHRLGIFFVRPGMAGNAAAGIYDGMHNFAGELHFVAFGTVRNRLLLGGHRRAEEQNWKKQQTNYNDAIFLTFHWVHNVIKSPSGKSIMAAL